MKFNFRKDIFHSTNLTRLLFINNISLIDTPNTNHITFFLFPRVNEWEPCTILIPNAVMTGRYNDGYKSRPYTRISISFSVWMLNTLVWLILYISLYKTVGNRWRWRGQTAPKSTAHRPPKCPWPGHISLRRSKNSLRRIRLEEVCKYSPWILKNSTN